METGAVDFPITRRTMERLDGWLMALAGKLLPLKQVKVDLPHMSGYVWEFPEKNERPLVVGKAVRMISGIRVAMLLADLGYISECGTILRTVSDFSNEILCICDGCKRGEKTTAHTRFVEQYFLPLARDADEFDKQSRIKWVTRDELMAAEYRWASENTNDAERFRKLNRFLASMYDKYVHGAGITSTELYNPYTRTFMLRGHESVQKREESKRATASKLHHLITALACSAEMFQMRELWDEIRRSGQELYASGELSQS